MHRLHAVLGGTTFEMRSDGDIAIFAEDVRAKLVLGDDIKQLPPLSDLRIASLPMHTRTTKGWPARSVRIPPPSLTSESQKVKKSEI